MTWHSASRDEDQLLACSTFLEEPPTWMPFPSLDEEALSHWHSNEWGNQLGKESQHYVSFVLKY